MWDELDMPDFQGEDGQVYAWDPSSKSYVPKDSDYLSADHIPDRGHASGGDNDLFDTDDTQDGNYMKADNPLMEGWAGNYSHLAAYGDNPSDGWQNHGIVIVRIGGVEYTGELIDTGDLDWWRVHVENGTPLGEQFWINGQHGQIQDDTGTQVGEVVWGDKLDQPGESYPPEDWRQSSTWPEEENVQGGQTIDIQQFDGTVRTLTIEQDHYAPEDKGLPHYYAHDEEYNRYCILANGIVEIYGLQGADWTALGEVIGRLPHELEPSSEKLYAELDENPVGLNDDQPGDTTFPEDWTRKGRAPEHSDPIPTTLNLHKSGSAHARVAGWDDEDWSATARVASSLPAKGEKWWFRDVTDDFWSQGVIERVDDQGITVFLEHGQFDHFDFDEWQGGLEQGLIAPVDKTARVAAELPEWFKVVSGDSLVAATSAVPGPGGEVWWRLPVLISGDNSVWVGMPNDHHDDLYNREVLDDMIGLPQDEVPRFDDLAQADVNVEILPDGTVNLYPLGIDPGLQNYVMDAAFDNVQAEVETLLFNYAEPGVEVPTLRRSSKLKTAGFAELRAGDRVVVNLTASGLSGPLVLVVRERHENGWLASDMQVEGEGSGLDCLVLPNGKVMVWVHSSNTWMQMGELQDTEHLSSKLAGRGYDEAVEFLADISEALEQAPEESYQELGALLQAGDYQGAYDWLDKEIGAMPPVQVFYGDEMASKEYWATFWPRLEEIVRNRWGQNYSSVRTAGRGYVQRTAMPTPDEAQAWAERIRQQKPNPDLVKMQGGVCTNWKVNEPVLQQVAATLGVTINVEVSSEWMDAYGTTNYTYVPSLGKPFDFRVLLNPMLDPQAANYALWHEIQHIAILHEGRGQSGRREPMDIQHPEELEADAMARQMHQLADLPLIVEIPVTEGSEADWYQELLAEGWSPEEALAEIVPVGQVTLEQVTHQRTATAYDEGIRALLQQMQGAFEQGDYAKLYQLAQTVNTQAEQAKEFLSNNDPHDSEAWIKFLGAAYTWRDDAGTPLKEKYPDLIANQVKWSSQLMSFYWDLVQRSESIMRHVSEGNLKGFKPGMKDQYVDAKVRQMMADGSYEELFQALLKDERWGQPLKGDPEQATGFMRSMIEWGLSGMGDKPGDPNYKKLTQAEDKLEWIEPLLRHMQEDIENVLALEQAWLEPAEQAYDDRFNSVWTAPPGDPNYRPRPTEMIQFNPDAALAPPEDWTTSKLASAPWFEAIEPGDEVQIATEPGWGQLSDKVVVIASGLVRHGANGPMWICTPEGREVEVYPTGVVVAEDETGMAYEFGSVIYDDFSEYDGLKDDEPGETTLPEHWGRVAGMTCPFCNSPRVGQVMWTDEEGWSDDYSYKCLACGEFFNPDHGNLGEGLTLPEDWTHESALTLPWQQKVTPKPWQDEQGFWCRHCGEGPWAASGMLDTHLEGVHGLSSNPLQSLMETVPVQAHVKTGSTDWMAERQNITLQEVLEAVANLGWSIDDSARNEQFEMGINQTALESFGIVSDQGHHAWAYFSDGTLSGITQYGRSAGEHVMIEQLAGALNTQIWSEYEEEYWRLDEKLNPEFYDEMAQASEHDLGGDVVDPDVPDAPPEDWNKESKLGIALNQGRMYHVAPAKARQSLEKSGIDHRQNGPFPSWLPVPETWRSRNTPADGHGGPAANYMFDNLGHAQQYAQGVSNYHQEPHDIWQVDATGIPQERDEVTNGGWYTDQTIPATNLGYHSQVAPQPESEQTEHPIMTLPWRDMQYGDGGEPAPDDPWERYDWEREQRGQVGPSGNYWQAPAASGTFAKLAAFEDGYVRVPYLWSQDVGLIVGFPEDHHGDVWNRHLGYESADYIEDYGTFQTLYQGNTNVEFYPDTGEIKQMRVLTAGPDLEPQIKQQTEANFRSWYEEQQELAAMQTGSESGLDEPDGTTSSYRRAHPSSSSRTSGRALGTNNAGHMRGAPSRLRDSSTRVAEVPVEDAVIDAPTRPDTTQMPDLNYVLDYNPEDLRDPGWYTQFTNDLLEPWHKCEDCYRGNISWEEARKVLYDWAWEIKDPTISPDVFEGLVNAIAAATPNEPFRHEVHLPVTGRNVFVIDRMSGHEAKLAGEDFEMEPDDELSFLEKTRAQWNLPTVGSNWTVVYTTESVPYDIQIAGVQDGKVYYDYINPLDTIGGRLNKADAEMDYADWNHLVAMKRIVPQERVPSPDLEAVDQMWPDTLPWGEAEQDYYRNARLAHNKTAEYEAGDEHWPAWPEPGVWPAGRYDEWRCPNCATPVEVEPVEAAPWNKDVHGGVGFHEWRCPNGECNQRVMPDWWYQTNPPGGGRGQYEPGQPVARGTSGYYYPDERLIPHEPEKVTGEGGRVESVNCSCGTNVPLWNYWTNPCPTCGRDYDANGNLLAPRSQWGEETGEGSYDDEMGWHSDYEDPELNRKMMFENQKPIETDGDDPSDRLGSVVLPATQDDLNRRVATNGVVDPQDAPNSDPLGVEHAVLGVPHEHRGSRRAEPASASPPLSAQPRVRQAREIEVRSGDDRVNPSDLEGRVSAPDERHEFEVATSRNRVHSSIESYGDLWHNLPVLGVDRFAPVEQNPSNQRRVVQAAQQEPGDFTFKRRQVNAILAPHVADSSTTLDQPQVMPDLNYVLDNEPGESVDSGWKASVWGPIHDMVWKTAPEHRQTLENHSFSSDGISWEEAHEWLIQHVNRQLAPEAYEAVVGATPDQEFVYRLDRGEMALGVQAWSEWRIEKSVGGGTISKLAGYYFGRVAYLINVRTGQIMVAGHPYDEHSDLEHQLFAQYPRITDAELEEWHQGQFNFEVNDESGQVELSNLPPLRLSQPYASYDWQRAEEDAHNAIASYTPESEDYEDDDDEDNHYAKLAVELAEPPVTQLPSFDEWPVLDNNPEVRWFSCYHSQDDKSGVPGQSRDFIKDTTWEEAQRFLLPESHGMIGHGGYPAYRADLWPEHYARLRQATPNQPYLDLYETRAADMSNIDIVIDTMDNFRSAYLDGRVSSLASNLEPLLEALAVPHLQDAARHALARATVMMEDTAALAHADNAVLRPDDAMPVLDARHSAQSSTREAMALTPEMWQEVLSRTPVFYHVTEPNRIGWIKQHGIAPGSEVHDKTEGVWNEIGGIPARAGAVYLWVDEGDALDGATWFLGIQSSDPAILHIDATKLDPNLIEADEDYPASDPATFVENYGGQTPDEYYGDTSGSDWDGWDSYEIAGNPGSEWSMNHPDLGKPEVSWGSYIENRTVAYKGTIPPEAIVQVELMSEMQDRGVVSLDARTRGIGTGEPEDLERFSKLAMGLKGDLPEDLQFVIEEGAEEEYGTRWVTVQAYMGREVIGQITVDQSEGSPSQDCIVLAEVDPEYQRRGIATEMIEYLRKSGYNAEHDWGNLSQAAWGWAKRHEPTKAADWAENYGLYDDPNFVNLDEDEPLRLQWADPNEEPKRESRLASLEPFKDSDEFFDVEPPDPNVQLGGDVAFQYVREHFPDMRWSDCPMCGATASVSDTNWGPHCFACDWWADKHTSKTAMPYHVSPQHNREQIEREGLVPQQTGHGGTPQDPDGVYYWDTPEQAQVFNEMVSVPGEEPGDIWHFELTPEEEAMSQDDPVFPAYENAPESWRGMYDEMGNQGAHFIADPAHSIPPERLRRHAMPYQDNTWYHVTDRSNLERIQREGLHGSQAGTPRVWGEYPVEENAVYLHPNVGGAWSYARAYGPEEARPEGRNMPVRWQDPVILRVKGLDYGNIAPDHEALGNLMEHLPWHDEEGEDPERLAVRRWIDEYEREHPRERDDFQHHIEMLRAMPPELRNVLAQEASVYGETAMHYGQIHPQQIEVGHAVAAGDDDWERNWERWQLAEQPREYTEDEQEQGVDMNDFDDWLATQPILSDEDVKNLDAYYEDPEDDSLTHRFQWTPLSAYQAEQQTQPEPPDEPYTFGQWDGPMRDASVRLEEDWTRAASGSFVDNGETVLCPNCQEETNLEVCPDCGKGLSPEWDKMGDEKIPFDTLPQSPDAQYNSLWTDVQAVPKTNWDKTDNSFPSMVSKVANLDPNEVVWRGGPASSNVPGGTYYSFDYDVAEAYAELHGTPGQVEGVSVSALGIRNPVELDFDSDYEQAEALVQQAYQALGRQVDPMTLDWAIWIEESLPGFKALGYDAVVVLNSEGPPGVEELYGHELIKLSGVSKVANSWYAEPSITIKALGPKPSYTTLAEKTFDPRTGDYREFREFVDYLLRNFPGQTIYIGTTTGGSNYFADDERRMTALRSDDPQQYSTPAYVWRRSLEHWQELQAQSQQFEQRKQQRTEQYPGQREGWQMREAKVWLFGIYDSRGGTVACEAPDKMAAYQSFLEFSGFDVNAGIGLMHDPRFTDEQRAEFGLPDIDEAHEAGSGMAEGAQHPDGSFALVGCLPDFSMDLETHSESGERDEQGYVTDQDSVVDVVGGKLAWVWKDSYDHEGPSWDDDAFSFFFVPWSGGSDSVPNTVPGDWMGDPSPTPSLAPSGTFSALEPRVATDEHELEKKVSEDGKEYGYGSGYRSGTDMLESVSPEQAEEVWRRYMAGDMDEIYEGLEESPLSGEWAGGPSIRSILEGFGFDLEQVPEEDYGEYINYYGDIWMEGFNAGQLEGFEAAVSAQSGKMDEAGSFYFPPEWGS